MAKDLKTNFFTFTNNRHSSQGRADHLMVHEVYATYFLCVLSYTYCWPVDLGIMCCYLKFIYMHNVSSSNSLKSAHLLMFMVWWTT